MQETKMNEEVTEETEKVEVTEEKNEKFEKGDKKRKTQLYKMFSKKGLTSIGKCCIITRVAKNNEYLFAEVHHG